MAKTCDWVVIDFFIHVIVGMESKDEQEEDVRCTENASPPETGGCAVTIWQQNCHFSKLVMIAVEEWAVSQTKPWMILAQEPYVYRAKGRSLEASSGGTSLGCCTMTASVLASSFYYSPQL